MAQGDQVEDLEALVRRVDPDRWLSSRFVGDQQARTHLMALYAFDYELARAPRVASNALLGEIRLAWWREGLDEIYGQRPVRSHPTALALARAVHEHEIPRSLLEQLVDARYRELEPEPMNLVEALAWARSTGGASAQAAAHILDPVCDPQAAASGGQAWAIGRLMATAGLEGPDSHSALAQALVASRPTTLRAFPAIAHAALSRPRARGRKVSALSARGLLLISALRGRV